LRKTIGKAVGNELDKVRGVTMGKIAARIPTPGSAISGSADVLVGFIPMLADVPVGPRMCHADGDVGAPSVAHV
jgi:hypothetical protein